MALTGKRIYVGFGFGAIQAGLFLYEAFGAAAFGRLVVAEVIPEVVDAVRRAGGYFSLNIAHAKRIEQARIGPIEIENPAQAADRQRLMAAIAQAQEIGTAIPNVTAYVSEGPGSLHRILAQGLRQKVVKGGPRAVIYTAENYSHAAELLQEKVLAQIPPSEQPAVCSRVRFLNTVIAKMSGVVADPQHMRQAGLTPITPKSQRAFLVESFNRILISKTQFDEKEASFQRGIGIFTEKENLLPFEEAKFYGHNAAHALAAYLGAVKGVQRIADLQAAPGVFAFLHAALVEETGQALIRKYAGLDPLFTEAGFREFVDDLLERMFNPYLQDTVERVGRDPARKLGWEDRLIGAIRLALQQGIQPRRYALGAAAALAMLAGEKPDLAAHPEAWLSPLWQPAAPAKQEQVAVLALVEEGRRRLKRWIESGFQDLESLFRDNLRLGG
ncbi:MAG: hypothetical protein JW953_06830 [Anaerolineae bacterium]|nr:hypothetical protein [Anaerolineae bacterium]